MTLREQVIAALIREANKDGMSDEWMADAVAQMELTPERGLAHVLKRLDSREYPPSLPRR